MKFTFTVEVELQAEGGFFAKRDEAREILLGNLREANPKRVDVAEGSFRVALWEPSEEFSRGKRT